MTSLPAHEAGAPHPSPRNAVARILGSRAFEGSARLSSFLRFICDETLAGRAGQINEHAIGVQVFGRPETFNSADDSIVRSSARLLRQRLARYYKEEGTADALRVVIPRGSYVPVFVEAVEAVEATGSAAVPMPVARRLPMGLAERLPRRRALLTLGGVAGVAIAAAAVAVPWRSAPPDVAALMWRLLLVSDRDLLIVPADSGLVMWQSEHHRALSLDDYIGARNRASDREPAAPIWPTSDARRYTGVVSMRLAVEMTRRAGPAASRVRVRFARDLHLNELKEANAVLIGAGNSNPWMQLFHEECIFRIDLDTDEQFVVTNRAPRGDELPRYVHAPGSVGSPGYAHIALKRNVGGSGRVLMVGGTGSAGTDAGIDFLLDPVALPRALAAIRPHGTALDAFEILLRTRQHGSGSAGYEVLAARFWPQV